MKNLSLIFFLHPSGLIQTAKETSLFLPALQMIQELWISWMSSGLLLIGSVAFCITSLLTLVGQHVKMKALLGLFVKKKKKTLYSLYSLNGSQCQMSGSCRAFQLLATRRKTDWRKLPACRFQCRNAPPPSPALTLSNYKRVQILFSQWETTSTPWHTESILTATMVSTVIDVQKRVSNLAQSAHAYTTTPDH